MKSKALPVLGSLALAFSAGTAQASVTIDLGNTTGQANVNALDGPDGNARTYSGVDGGNAFNVRITGWSISNANVIYNAFLGAYTGWGLGVTNQAESGQNNTHTIDNAGSYDFVVLQFDKDVVLDWALFNSINGADTDATIGRGVTGAAWNASPAWNGSAASVLNSTFSTIYNSTGPASDNWRDINSPNASGNIWMISALRPATTGDDSFKLQSLKVSVPALPEPATWLQLILGFGMIGGIMRHGRVRQRFSRDSTRAAIA